MSYGFKARWIRNGIEGICYMLEAAFNTSTGHDHDGTDSKKIPLTSVSDVTALAAEVNVGDVSVARADGLGMIHVYSATFDPKGTAGHRTVAAHDLGVDIPANMLIVGGMVDVLETFTDGDDDSATIAIHVVSANDIVTATAISGGSNIWDQGRQDIVPDSTGSTAVKTTEASAITATVGDAALTAGKAVIYLFCIKATADVAA